MPTIFMEGVDKSGKSYLADLLHNTLGMPYYHGVQVPMTKEELRTKPFDTARIEMLMMYELLRQTHINIIVDRFHLSEVVYAHAYGRTIDEDFVWEMDRKFAELGVVIIYVSAPIEVMKARWKEESLVEFSEASLIVEEYEKIMLKTRCKVVRYTPYG